MHCVRSLAVFVLLSAVLLPVVQAADPVPPPAKIKYGTREIAALRAPLLGYSPEQRAAGASARIEGYVAAGGPYTTTTKAVENGMTIEVNGQAAFMILAADLNELAGETLEGVASLAAHELKKALDEAAEQRSLRHLLTAVGLALVATVAVVVVLSLIIRIRRWFATSLRASATERLSRLGLAATVVLHPDYVGKAIVAGAALFSWIVGGLAAYVYATFVLGLFPLTRPLGEGLKGALLSMLEKIGAAVVGALPGLTLAIVIFILARLATQLVGAFFQRLEAGVFTVPWLQSETAAPTKRIAIIVIWLFALVMAYPYLPGADSEAFKGLSVLVGLMISLGASSTVGQAASGLILMYSRAYRVGEYVRIGDTEGTVVEVGMLVTRIRTGMGEEIMLPNSLVMSTASKNYSRAFPGGRGYVIDTTVNIGYGTPWRQVHAMLLEASNRTEDIADDPAPYVIQAALSDHFVEYRLVAYASSEGSRRRAQTLDRLHANVQDVFNENGVQIMSPHYEGDPSDAKVVDASASNPPLKRQMARATLHKD